jgi:glycosyltransferase involved in cell wall biosynthesis
LRLEKYQISPLLNAIPHNGLENILLEAPGDKIRVLKEKIIGRPSIVQVGALDENKNQLFSLDCLKVIKEKVPDVLLLIIGDGYKKNELICYTQEHNIDENVLFAGQLERRDCFHLMRESDLLILTSKSESFPNVLLEAQLLELPVVSFDVGAAVDILRHGETGYLIPNGHMNKFIENITRLLLDKELASEFGSAGKKRIIKNFSMEKKVENFIKLLSDDLIDICGS